MDLMTFYGKILKVKNHFDRIKTDTKKVKCVFSYIDRDGVQHRITNITEAKLDLFDDETEAPIVNFTMDDI